MSAKPHNATPETGLCARPWCDDAALPGDEFCADCAGDIENLLAEEKRERAAFESAAAWRFRDDGYEPDDPKSHGYRDRYADLWDMREGK